MTDYICIGDNITLFCNDLEGYVFCNQSSSVYNGLWINKKQDRTQPQDVKNLHTVVFTVYIQNRYKLTKKLRTLEAHCSTNVLTRQLRTELQAARLAAEAEDADNRAEQKRQISKKLKYGDIVQLYHVFTKKFIHVSTTKASVKDKNNMMVSLESYNAKHAQFRIQPRYKVKSEGDNVQNLDQVTFESVKSPGNYFHCSLPFKIDRLTTGAELNLGINRTGFTLIRSLSNCEPDHVINSFIKGGSFIRLFHRELEAYLTTEGMFLDEGCIEDVYLRLRPIDQENHPSSLLPSTSAIFYWQIESEDSILNGDFIRWSQQVRLRHLVTQQFLCVDSNFRVTMTTDPKPHTVFRLHPVKQDNENIRFESFARIEHELTKRWLHALKEEYYERKNNFNTIISKFTSIGDSSSQMRKIASDEEQKYDDAFSLQYVENDHQDIFHYVAGAAPFIFRLLKAYDSSDLEIASSTGAKLLWKKASKTTTALNIIESHKTVTALNELTEFLTFNGEPNKNRQKLLRNLRIIDLVMRFLRIPMKNVIERPHIYGIIRGCYHLLSAYMSGQSQKNKLYMAQYMPFFYEQLTLPGELGLSVVQMLCFLIRDNRQLVNSLNNKEIDKFISLLNHNRTFHYLDALAVLCVCNGVAIPSNQNYIISQLVKDDMTILIRTEMKTLTNGEAIFITSPHLRRTLPLVEYVKQYKFEHWYKTEYEFLTHQLEFFDKLCYGANQFCIRTITESAKLLSWNQAFCCLQDENLPSELRALYGGLILSLFINTGTVTTVIDRMGLSFVYESIDSKKKQHDQSVIHFLKKKKPKHNFSFNEESNTTFYSNVNLLHHWIEKFVQLKKFMIAENVGENKLIAQIMCILKSLIELGFYGNSDNIEELHELVVPLLELVDGRTDKPFTAHGLDSREIALFYDYYQSTQRFEFDSNTTALLDAKLRVLDVLDLVFTFQYNCSLQKFIELFKRTYERSGKLSENSAINCMLNNDFDPFLNENLEVSRIALKKLNNAFSGVFRFSEKKFTDIMMDLSKYENDAIRVKSISLLNKYFSARHELFIRASKVKVLITYKSVQVHQETQTHIVTCKKLSKHELNNEQCIQLSNIFIKMASYCTTESPLKLPHSMNQNILTNHGLLSILFDILSEAGQRHLEGYVKEINFLETIRNALMLLKSLCMANEYVQRRIYERLDMLMVLRGVEQELAEALQAAFYGSESLCLRIPSHAIQRIVVMLAEKRENAPALLNFLRTLVKIDTLNLPIKRNQILVMKYIMQNYHKVAYCLKQSREIKAQILRNELGHQHASYLLSLIDLLATCAERPGINKGQSENRFIESLCQKFFKVDELLWLLAHNNIHCNSKVPIAKYLIWVYLNTCGSLIESGVAELPHHFHLWRFFEDLPFLLQATRNSCCDNPDSVSVLLQRQPNASDQPTSDEIVELLRCRLFYVLLVIAPIFASFFRRFYSPDRNLYPKELTTVNNLALEFSELIRIVASSLNIRQHVLSLLEAALQLFPKSEIPAKELEEILNIFNNLKNFKNLKDFNDNKNFENLDNEYGEEHFLNQKLHIFSHNFKKVYGGENKVGIQLCHGEKIDNEAKSRVYSNKNKHEELPLGEEFQNFVYCFINNNSKDYHDRYGSAIHLTNQLTISFKQSQKLDDKMTIDQEKLDVKCLQLLRAMIHNEEHRLPEDWEKSSSHTQKQLDSVFHVQSALNSLGTLPKVLVHLSRKNDHIVREALAFVSAMLFNANRESQQSMLQFFLNTREESFFFAIKQRMQVSASATKERRSLVSQQYKEKENDSGAQAGSLRKNIDTGKMILQHFQSLEESARRRHLRHTSMFEKRRPDHINLRQKSKRLRPTSTLSVDNQRFSNTLDDRENMEDLEDVTFHSNKNRNYSVNQIKEVTFEGDTNVQRVSYAVEKNDGTNSQSEKHSNELQDGTQSSKFRTDDDEEDLEAAAVDEDFIGLVLKVIAQMCDGQYSELQNYLREQPDNIKSFNIVAEALQYLSIIYGNISQGNINLLTIVLNSLNETVSGNQENRVVVFDNRIIDYINFILRAGQFTKCSLESVLNLLSAIGDLLMSLLEESSPNALATAREISECLDKSAIARIMSECYFLSRPRNKNQLAKAKKIVELTKDIKKKKFLASLDLKESYLRANMLKKIKTAELSNLEKDKVTYIIPAVLETLQKLDRKHLVHVGFKYYFLLKRFGDLSMKNCHVCDSNTDHRVIEFYDKNSMSVEIIKDNFLQKIRFRVKNKDVLRDEVKEKLIWEVDRSSGASKIRDLMIWNEDIQKDIWYQKKVLRKKICAIFMKFWIFWNYMPAIISLAINIIMLITWDARGVRTPDYGLTNLWPNITDPIPIIDVNVMTESHYKIIINILAFLHVGFSIIMLISYFLLNHPQLPQFNFLRRTLKPLVLKIVPTNKVHKINAQRHHLHEQHDREESESEQLLSDYRSKLDVQLISYQTLYYILFIVFSLTGALWSEYFFAFHLLNFCHNQQLLSRVIRAVTLNGRSLLWVALLGTILIYNTSLVAFAFLRSGFQDFNNSFYCNSLYQCFITVFRYGIVTDMYQSLVLPIAEHGHFDRFVMYAAFHLFFYLTINIIGTNIIMGIIVDTFSELRDLKWQAERDMKSYCYICNRAAYDFEYHGKGFMNHITQEHNMWAYIYLFVHLDDSKINDLTALELHVQKQLSNKKYDFFPLGRAMILEKSEDAEEDEKIEEILRTVRRLEHSNQVEQKQRLHEAEMLRRREWEAENKNFFIYPTASGDIIADKEDVKVNTDVDKSLSKTNSERNKLIPLSQMRRSSSAPRESRANASDVLDEVFGPGMSSSVHAGRLLRHDSVGSDTGSFIWTPPSPSRLDASSPKMNAPKVILSEHNSDHEKTNEAYEDDFDQVLVTNF